MTFVSIASTAASFGHHGLVHLFDAEATAGRQFALASQHSSDLLEFCRREVSRRRKEHPIRRFLYTEFRTRSPIVLVAKRLGENDLPLCRDLGPERRVFRQSYHPRL